MDRKELKCMVVDGSKASGQAITDLIADYQDLVLTVKYRNGIDALNNMGQREINLIFLAVELPLIDGFEFLDKLKDAPQVILVCDKPEYALKAFEYYITDYLKKPFDRQRFNIAVKRAVANHTMVNGNLKGDYINVKSNLQHQKVLLDHINFIEGLGDYIRLVTDHGTLFVLTTMKSFLERLPEGKFLRIHKSYAINTDKVNRFSSTTVEIEGREIPVSRSKSEA
ncbi:hypothetical protein LCGC14_1481320 [marine sediment metagenome]|uniref:Response regulator transcription factor n=2 Tax=root TaxID=1 RepID=A0A831QNA5_9FLAO|nr:response regulator transcription factor [Pricia sp.]HEA19821.1 response regulator transcription factor [Pricia antarctica]